MPAEREIPLFPLNTVLFPGGPLMLRIFEPRYVDMVKECARDQSVFGVCLILEGREAGSAVTTVRVGTTARIVDFFTTEDGLLGIRATGVQRFFLKRTSVRDNGLIIGEVELLSMPPARQRLATEYLLLRTLLERLLENVGEYYPERTARDLDDADWVSARLAELLPLELSVKQELLEELDPAARLVRILELVPALQGDDD